jgi:Tol biopolymer transport system component
MNRSSRSWHRLGLAALASLAALAAGCDITPEQEEGFQLTGSLSQATIDTTTTDHVRPALSPDGTRIMFITDAFAAGKNQAAANDYVLVDVPPPGSIPPLVDNVGLNPGWIRVNLGLFPNDSGILFNPFESIKGEVSWNPNGTGVAAVVHNDDGNERLYTFDLLPPDSNTNQIPVANATLVDDVDFGSIGNRTSYHYLTPAVSPNGEWVAYARYYFRAGDETAGVPVDAEYMAIYAYNLNTGRTVRVTNGSTLEQDPTWSPDGSQIIFTAQIGEVGTRDLMRVTFNPDQDAEIREWVSWEDGGQKAPFTDGRIQLTTTAGTADWKLPVGSFDAAWMRDGRVVFTSTRRSPGVSERVRNIWVMNSDGSDQRLAYFTRWDDAQVSTANFATATSDAASMIVFSSRFNRSPDFLDQKNDLWVLRGF